MVLVEILIAYRDCVYSILLLDRLSVNVSQTLAADKSSKHLCLVTNVRTFLLISFFNCRCSA